MNNDQEPAFAELLDQPAEPGLDTRSRRPVASKDPHVLPDHERHSSIPEKRPVRGFQQGATVPSDRKKQGSQAKWLLPLLCLLVAGAVWQAIASLRIFPDYAFPSPLSVARRFRMEAASLRLLNDAVVSIWRVFTGFLISVLLAIPAGFWIGQSPRLKLSIMPLLNFFRFLSPLAWIPFAILWFNIGDKPAIFIIFFATFFPLVISIVSALETIPAKYYRVAEQYGFSKKETFLKITAPYTMAQLVTSLRVSFGISWLVIIAAEMVGCQEGLGYGIWNARNSLNLDTAVCYMITIGLIGILMDRGFLLYKKRW